MHSKQVVVQGMLRPDGKLELDERPDLPPGKVLVTLQPVSEMGGATANSWEVLQQIKKNQEARGYKGRTMEEMEADEAAQRAEEEEYEERWRQIWDQSSSPNPPDKA